MPKPLNTTILMAFSWITASLRGYFSQICNSHDVPLSFYLIKQVLIFKPFKYNDVEANRWPLRKNTNN